MKIKQAKPLKYYIFVELNEGCKNVSRLTCPKTKEKFVAALLANLFYTTANRSKN